MYATYRALLDALQVSGVDAALLQEAADEAERSRRSIRDVLINDRIVDETELTETLAGAFGLNSIDLVDYPIDPQAMLKLPLGVVTR